MHTWIFLLIITTTWAAKPDLPPPLNCGCEPVQGVKNCGVNPAFMSQNHDDLYRQLGFDVPGDNVKLHKTAKGLALYLAFAAFLEKSDRARLFYPEYYTRATKEAPILTLKSRFIPKNPTELSEYFRCSIPQEKYCLFKDKLSPYLGLAAKVSKIDYSFLACQAYVESRFKNDAKSVVGALGYSQIRPINIEHMNSILHKSIHTTRNRTLASTAGPREKRIRKVQKDISKIWAEFWKGTKKAPSKLTKSDLTCHRQAFLAQSLALKTDMLAFATSASGIKADFDENGDFHVENMDKGDSLLLLAASYNIGVTKTIRLIANYCSGVSKLKECLDHMRNAKIDSPKKQKALEKDVQAIVNYVMRIRDCSQQFSAEQLDFDDDERWTTEKRTEKMNAQRDRVAQCLLNPCPLPKESDSE